MIFLLALSCQMSGNATSLFQHSFFYAIYIEKIWYGVSFNLFQMWPCVRRQSSSLWPRCDCPLCPWRGCWRVFRGVGWIVRAWRGWRRPALLSSRSSTCCDCGGSRTKTRTSCTALYKVQTKPAQSFSLFLIKSCNSVLNVCVLSLQVWTTARGRSPAATAWRTWP